MAIDLTEIPDDFGQGGRYLQPGGSNGSPNLRDLLLEHKTTLEQLSSPSAGMGASDIAIQDAANLYVATDIEAALAEVKTLTVQKRTLTILESDLVAAATTQTLSLGATLPANARIAYVDAHDYTPFTGGSISNMLFDIGTSGDIDAIVAGASAFIAAVDGGPSTLPKGVRPNKLFATVGAQLQIKFTATGDNVVNATAGALTVDVWFFIAP